ncbi:hypothetical protein HDF08_002252 [Edaphobacter lichenicola]|uniref:Uncharacterized protein n=1 Tax=Tunturiibacter lichenicola TaxID=2051959 RepID=A0A852VJ44_9BACT|nr:hypothetical protein [Edaphobacter lichenicola]
MLSWPHPYTADRAYTLNGKLRPRDNYLAAGKLSAPSVVSILFDGIGWRLLLCFFLVTGSRDSFTTFLVDRTLPRR